MHVITTGLIYMPLVLAEMQLSEASEFAKLLKRGLNSEAGPQAPAAPSSSMMADDADEDMDVPEPAAAPPPLVAPKADNRRFRCAWCPCRGWM